MDIWIVENGELVLYKRSGQCNKCGQCCCTHTISYQMKTGLVQESATDGNDGDWSDREGWSMFIAQGIWWYFNVARIEKKDGDDVVCNRFKDGLCTIWQSDDFKPICRYWPFHPSNIEKFPECGFSFERVPQ